MANLIPKEVISKVQSEVNIVDIVSQYVQLKKRGKNYFGQCPFHDERTPSFSVTEEKQIFYCFSCGRGGSVFSFIGEIEGLSYPESVAKVVELAGLPYQLNVSHTSDVSTTQHPHAKLFDLHKKASDLYTHILMRTNGGDAALNYLRERGYSEETIQAFQLGYAPKDRTALISTLSKEEVDQAQLQETGLFVYREAQDEFIDRFSQRIMIPLRDPQGKVIGFSGRMLMTDDQLLASDEEQQAKYLNSPETPLFNKRSFLFNFDLARPEIRREGVVILFEGYMDVIAAWQAGVKTGVASMGTSLTKEQISILNRVANNIIIAYDGDRAGLDATNRAIELIQQYSSSTISIFPMENGLDPDEYLKKYGAKQFISQLEHYTETVYQFKKRYYLKQFNLENEKEKIAYLNKLIAEIATISSVIERELAMNELVKDYHLSHETIVTQVQTVLKKETKNRQKSAEQIPLPTEGYLVSQQSTRHKAEKRLLYRLIHEPLSWTYLFSLNKDFCFPDDDFQQIYILLQHFREQNDINFSLHDFLNTISDEHNRNIISSVEFLDLPEECTKQEINDLVYYLSNRYQLKEQLERVNQQFKQALERGEHEKAQQLAVEKVSIQRKLKQKQL